LVGLGVGIGIGIGIDIEFDCDPDTDPEYLRRKGMIAAGHRKLGLDTSAQMG